MKIDGNDWKEKMGHEKSETKKLFDSLLFYRQLASLFLERVRIIKELDCLLLEDQAKFAEYLSDTIHQYETECDFSLDDISGVYYNTDIDPPAYVDDEGNIVDINEIGRAHV